MKNYFLLLCLLLQALSLRAPLFERTPVELPEEEPTSEEKLKKEQEAKQAFLQKQSAQMELATQKALQQGYESYYDGLVKQYSDNLKRFTLDELITGVKQAIGKQPNSATLKRLKQTRDELDTLQNPSKAFGGYTPQSFKKVMQNNAKVQDRNRNNYKNNLNNLIKNDKSFKDWHNQRWLMATENISPLTQLQFKNNSTSAEEKNTLGYIEEYANENITKAKEKIEQAKTTQATYGTPETEINKAKDQEQSATQSLEYYNKILTYAQELQKLPTVEKIEENISLPGKPLAKKPELVLEKPVIEQKILSTPEAMRAYINQANTLDVTNRTTRRDLITTLNTLRDKKLSNTLTEEEQGLLQEFGDIVYNKLSDWQNKLYQTEIGIANGTIKQNPTMEKKHESEMNSYALIYNAYLRTVLFQDNVALLIKERSELREKKK